jgi:hypothetical protein
MTVRDTSRAAFHGAAITAGQKRVLDFLDKHPRVDWSRSELATMSGIPINVVCPRVLELIQSGVLFEMPARKCKFSGRTCHPVARVPMQMSLVA